MERGRSESGIVNAVDQGSRWLVVPEGIMLAVVGYVLRHPKPWG